MQKYEDLPSVTMEEIRTMLQAGEDIVIQVFFSPAASDEKKMISEGDAQ